jgi:Relaxase/Mobilisation nuclease domain
MTETQNSGGGTFCRFTVGRQGTSAAHLRYISRVSAVETETGRCDFITQSLPEYVLRAESFYHLRDRLLGYAKMRERQETGRTHYRAIVSFEQDIPQEQASQMVREWLQETFPNGQAVAFFHHNTEHLHAHIWIDARGTDGKKLHFSARDFRRIDEAWNTIYSREMGRDIQEHLQKKYDKQRTFYKQHYGDKERNGDDKEKHCYSKEQPDKERTIGDDRTTSSRGEASAHGSQAPANREELLRAALESHAAQGGATRELDQTIQASLGAVQSYQESVRASQELYQGLERLYRAILLATPDVLRGKSRPKHREQKHQRQH